MLQSSILLNSARFLRSWNNQYIVFSITSSFGQWHCTNLFYAFSPALLTVDYTSSHTFFIYSVELPTLQWGNTAKGKPSKHHIIIKQEKEDMNDSYSTVDPLVWPSAPSTRCGYLYVFKYQTMEEWLKPG